MERRIEELREGLQEGLERGGRRQQAIRCLDCGGRCMETRVAKPMQGQCVGFTKNIFYVGEEVQAGELLHRVQKSPLRTCVQTQTDANKRGEQAENRLTDIPFALLGGSSTAVVQGECKKRWTNIYQPPEFFHTCNDPLRAEEAQVSDFATVEEFEPLIPGFRDAVARAINLQAGNRGLVVSADEVIVDAVNLGYDCAKNASDPLDPCRRKLAKQGVGLRVRFHVTGHYDGGAEEAALDDTLYAFEVFQTQLGETLTAQIGTTLLEVAMTDGRDHTICRGPGDTLSCLQGVPCGLVGERVAFTRFVSTNWWTRSAAKWFGGTVPPWERVREWYCDSDPRLYLGKRRNGQWGTLDVYVRNGNPNIKNECDYAEEPGYRDIPLGDAQCATINGSVPVPSDCCGYCFLSNLHLMELWNCTGLTGLPANRQGRIHVANYCLRTQACSEERPCTGDPVRMGDPHNLLSASASDIYCDPLDRGCGAPYVDGRLASEVRQEIIDRWEAELATPPPSGPPLANLSAAARGGAVGGFAAGVANATAEALSQGLNRTLFGLPIQERDPGARPVPQICGYRSACDLRIDSIRYRIGYYESERRGVPAGTRTGPDPAPIVGGVLGFLALASAAGYVYYRVWKKRKEEEERKRKKAVKKYLDKRSAQTGLEYDEWGEVAGKQA